MSSSLSARGRASVLAGLLCCMAPGAVQAHEGHELRTDADHTLFLCDYKVSGQQDRSNGQVLKGTLDKTAVPYFMDWKDKLMYRVDKSYPAEISDSAVRFAIGAMSYELDRKTGAFRGHSHQAAIAGSADLEVQGQCTAQAPGQPYVKGGAYGQAAAPSVKP